MVATAPDELFRSALPRRERPPKLPSAMRQAMTTVSIRAPAKGATPAVGHCHTLLTSLFRSALPRRERPAAAVGNSDQMQPVSIRAPAKGATATASDLASMLDKFRSALPRRERPCRSEAAQLFQNRFRSALPRRERPAPSQPLPPGPALVSIRAPAKGATRPSRYAFLISSSFDPRSREGSDRAEHIDQFRNCRFDPRSREGSDRSELARRGRMLTVSIRAPAKGATPAAGTSMTGRHRVSIRAPAKGATCARPWGPQGWLMFRSALPRRERPILRFSARSHRCFDPRSREGSDPVLWKQMG